MVFLAFQQRNILCPYAHRIEELCESGFDSEQELPDWEMKSSLVPEASTGEILRPPLEGNNGHSFGNLSFLLFSGG